ncbi:ABC transporter permease [Corynebacterium sp. HMSC034B08]|uniref:ABC transporter permease n=1 Tax=Corynebacterium sp. HMSC034B08 TaxID=1715135 RepID=UPI0008A9553D|nr:ABC transporter permease [Corynebacterium sp. HMSC034B08]OHO31505.1 ABC transporter permease [Corynebacterium sp. HMSC034B08]
MIRTISKHLLRFVLLLVAASLIIFTLLRAVPGDPARIALGVAATEADIAELNTRLGLDRPLPAQYFDWISGLITGDFGVSLSSGKEITESVIERAGVSLTLTLLAMAVSLLVAVPAGVYIAGRRRSAGSAVVSGLSQVGIIVPSFLVGIALVALFSVRLGWLPANGWGTPAHVVLPVAALSLVQASILTRYIAASVREELGKDYVRTGRAQGSSIRAVLYSSVLRNAALPVITVVGVQLASLVVGAVVIERVFTIPGLGTMLLDAVGNRDLTTVQTVMMLVVAFTLVVNLIVDLTYTVVDPRIRRQA